MKTDLQAATPLNDPCDCYAFPVSYSDRWQGGAITETWVKGAVTLCGHESTAGATVTLTAPAYAQYRREETTPSDGAWPTLWGSLPVIVGRINAVWVPLSWLPSTALMWPGRGSSSVSAWRRMKGAMR